MQKHRSEKDIAEALEFIEHMGWTHPAMTDQQKRGLALLVLEHEPLSFLAWRIGKPMRMTMNAFRVHVFPRVLRRWKLVLVAGWLFAVLLAFLAWADVLGWLPW